MTDIEPASAIQQRGQWPVTAPDGGPAGRPVPPRVLHTYPDIDPASWRWLSPLRLAGRHRWVLGHIVLVVLDTPAGRRTVGAIASPTDDHAAAFAELHMSMALSVGREIACIDGSPVVGHGGTCIQCGRLPGVHVAPPAPSAPAALPPAALPPAALPPAADLESPEPPATPDVPEPPDDPEAPEQPEQVEQRDRPALPGPAPAAGFTWFLP